MDPLRMMLTMPLLTSRVFIFAAIVHIFLLALERGEGLKD
jgi:hypothetical protein